MPDPPAPPYQTQLERLELLTPLALAVYGAALLASQGGSLPAWALVGLAAALGAAGLTGWRPFRKRVALRMTVLLVSAWLLMAMTGGPDSLFLLWYVVITGLYPLLIGRLPTFIMLGLAGACYLLLAPFSEVGLPFFAVAARGLLLILIGLLAYQLGSLIRQHAAENAMLVQQASDGIFITDLRGRILDANLSACAMLGYSREEIVELAAADLVPVADLAAAPLRYDDLNAGQTLRSERRLRRKDGGLVPVEISAKRLPDGRLQAIVRDITERQRAEDALRLVEERYRMISELTSDYAYAMRVDEDGTPRGEWLTEAFTRIFGYSLEEVLERGGVLSLVYPDDLPIVQQHLSRVLSGQADSCEMRLVTKSGEVRWLSDHARPVWDDKRERVVRIYGGSQDITERKRAEAELQRRRLDLERAQAVAQVGSWELDLVKGEMDWSHELYRIFGLETHLAAMRQTDLIEMIHPDDRAGHAAFLKRSVDLQPGEMLEPLEYRIRRPAGEERFVETRAEAEYDADGRKVRVFGTVQDITERKRVEAELQRRLAELTAIYRSAQRLQHLLGSQALPQEIVRVLEDSVGYSYAAVLLIDERSNTLAPFAVSEQGRGPAFAARDRAKLAALGVRVGQGITGWVAQNGQSVCVGDADADPRYLAAREGIRSELCVPLRVADKVIGVVNIESTEPNAYNGADQRLLETIAAQIAVSIQNAQLLDSVRNQEQRLRALAGYLQSAQETERARIAREIHDELGQALTALKLDVMWLAKRLPEDSAPVQSKIEEMLTLNDETLLLVRRIASDLRPGLLDDLGLAAALRWQARQFAERSGIDCRVSLPGEDGLGLDRDREVALFRIFQELLTNVARHAGATLVEADVRTDQGVLEMTVHDDGRGITAEQVAESKSLGLLGIRERAGQWGGEVVFEGSPEAGTTVTVRLPISPGEASHD